MKVTELLSFNSQGTSGDWIIGHGYLLLCIGRKGPELRKGIPASAGRSLLSLRALSFDREVVSHPVPLTPCVMADILVAHGHQLPSGLLGLRSWRTRAVDDDLGPLVGDQLLCPVGLPRR